MAPPKDDSEVGMTRSRDDGLQYSNETLKPIIEELWQEKFAKRTVTFEELWTGARLAKNFAKHDYEDSDDDGQNDDPEISERHLLTEGVRDALKIQDDLKFWLEPKDLVVTLMTCCLASLTQGWDQVANGNLGWPGELGLEVNADGTGKDIWLFGVANGITWFAAAFIGSLAIDPLCHGRKSLGRRGAVFLAAMFSFASVIGGSRAKSWQGYIISRLFLGIGIGAKASIVPVWESEVLPPKKRGPLLVLWQVFVAVGIFAGSIATYIFRSHWRNQVLTGAIPAFALLVFSYVSSESPRWLILQNRYPEAFKVLVRLRRERILAAEELCFVHFQVTHERAQVLEEDPNYTKGNNRLHFSDRLFKLPGVPSYARAMLATMIVMLSQQLSGINILAFLASIFFSAAGLRKQPDPKDHDAVAKANKVNAEDSLRLTIGFAIANAVFSSIAYFFIEPEIKHRPKKRFHPPPWMFGRRTLLLLSLGTGAAMLLILAFLLNLDSSNPAKLPVVMLFIILFTLCYSPGAGAVPFAYSAEVWPNEGRELGMSWAVFWNFSGAGCLALLVPRCLQWGAPKTLGLFAGLSLFGFILVFFYMPATRHAMTTDEMSQKFELPIRAYFKKKLKELKWWSTKNHDEAPDESREASPEATEPKRVDQQEPKAADAGIEEITAAPKPSSSVKSEQKEKRLDG